jgi:agmatinase
MNQKHPYTFAGLPEIPYRDAKFLILPVPYEATVSFRRGAKFGPEGIICSSRYMELFDEETMSEPVTGIMTLPEIPVDIDSPAKMMKRIENAAARHVKERKFLIGLGGEHSISIPLIKLQAALHKKLKIIHLDAHADMRETFDGSKLSHACVMRRAVEFGCDVFSFGIRSISKEEFEFISGNKHVSVVFAHQMHEKQIRSYIETLPQGPYYISIDLDFFDPAYIPETGTPEPGGFGWYQTLGFLRGLIETGEVIGADVVELAPSFTYSPSCFFAARLVYKLISYLSLKN